MADTDRFLRKLALIRDAFASSPSLPSEVAATFNDWAATHNLSLPPANPAPLNVASALADAFVPPGPARDAASGIERVHPFSDALLSFPDAPSQASLKKTVASALGALSFSDTPTSREAFFALWRNLLPLLRQSSSDEAAAFWDHVPAAPHLPDHGLFQQARVATAFADLKAEGDGLQTDAAFVLFTLGPVQQFIQQARKTKDLYWGSYLLSSLCWIGIREIIQVFGPDSVIFPDLYGQPLVDQWMETDLSLSVEDSQAHHSDLPTLPNRFFAVIEAASDDAIVSRMTGVADAVQTAWTNRGKQLFDGSRFGGMTPPDAFERHMENALSTYWAGIRLQPGSTPITPEGTLDYVKCHFKASFLDTARERLDLATPDAPPATRFGLLYNVLYTLAEKRLGAQKTVRAFTQIEDGAGERGRKCSVCGERNTLFHRGHPAQIRHNEGAVDMKGAVDLVHLREGEGLCGVCFTKRFADHTNGTQHGLRFDSTADVATASMRAVDEASVRHCETDMRETVGPGAFDRQLLYRENLTPDYLGTYVFPDRENDTAFLSQKAEALQTTYDNKLSSTAKKAQSSYYAIIALDGDNMGKWLSGSKAPALQDLYPEAVSDALDDEARSNVEKLGKRPMTPAVHATMSQALATFALQQVRTIVEDHSGFLVYAGGDDVLAFVSVDVVLDVLIELRAAFSGHRSLEDGTVDFTEDASGFLQNDDRLFTTMGPTASASAGVAIAHYKTPLGMVLDTAYTMEKRAKNAERDRAALAVLKRSGERNEAVLPFRMSDHPEGLLAVFRDLVAELQANDISPTFMRTLRRELHPLMDREHGTLDAFDIEDEFLRAELKRLILRKSNATREWAIATAERLTEAYNMSGQHPGNFLAALDIALFLYKETHTAHAPVDYAA